MKKLITLFVCLTMCFGFKAFSQATNDICSSAQLVTATTDTTCNEITGNITTASQENLPDSCAGARKSPAANDLWYKFVATATTHIVDAMTSGGPQSGAPGLVVVVYNQCSGTILNCGNPTVFGNFVLPGKTSVTVSGLTIGNTYSIRVYAYGQMPPLNGAFTLCVHAPAPPPANDACTGATSVTASTDTTCTSIKGSFAGASQENVPDSCAPSRKSLDAKDTWYKFVATSANMIVDVKSATVSVDAFLYNSCGGSIIGCGNPTGFPFNGNTANTQLLAKGLTVGNTYYLRLYPNSGGGFQFPPANLDFMLCIHAAPPAPVNDLCANATVLTVSPDTTCNATLGTLYGANSESNADSCSNPNGAAYDVWYAFAATNATQIIDVKRVSQQTGNLIASLYDACGGTRIACGPGSGGGNLSFYQTNLIPTHTYYVRVYQTGATLPTPQAKFNICVRLAPPAPVNDLCANATPLTVDSVCNPKNGTVAYATQSGAAPAGCNGVKASGSAYDVWYSFVAKSPNEVITVNALAPQGGPGGPQGFGAVIELYSGSCTGNMVDCATPSLTQNGTARPGVTSLPAKGLTVGSTYLVRVYAYGNAPLQKGPFSICVYNQQAYDECSGAKSVGVAKNKAACKSIVVNTGLATYSGTVPCDNPARPLSDDDVWFKFQATDTVITLSVPSASMNPTVITNFGAVLYKKCGSLKDTVKCFRTVRDSIVFHNLKVDSTYYLDIYTASNQSPTGSFDMCLYARNGKASGISTTRSLSTSLNVYPNPTKSQLNVSFSANSSLAVRMINISGQQVFAETFTRFTGEYDKSIDMSSLPAGIYMIQITTEKESVTRKVVKE